MAKTKAHVSRNPIRRSSRRPYAVGILVLFVSLIIAFTANNGAYVPSVQDYYGSLESRLGYWLLLGNTRHCGYYPKGQISPFPISKAHRAMEEKIFSALGLGPGSKVLDAGAGSGYVAMYMARKGLNVQAIDITPHHVADARKVVAKNGLQDKISVDYADYHDLSAFPDGSFDGIYTMETFVHADDPAKVLSEFYRLLRPGGVYVLHEYAYRNDSKLLRDVLRLSHCQNTLAEGEYESLFVEAGFKDYQLDDMTDHVLPLIRLFGVVGYVPYQFFKLIGIQERFTNVMGGVETWLHWGEGRYNAIRVVKP